MGKEETDRVVVPVLGRCTLIACELALVFAVRMPVVAVGTCADDGALVHIDVICQPNAVACRQQIHLDAALLVSFIVGIIISTPVIILLHPGDVRQEEIEAAAGGDALEDSTDGLIPALEIGGAKTRLGVLVLQEIEEPGRGRRHSRPLREEMLQSLVLPRKEAGR